MTQSSSLGQELIDRLRARNLDPALRSDTDALMSGAVDLDTALHEAALPADTSPEVRREVEEYLGGVSSPLAGLMTNLVTGDQQGGRGLLGALGSMLGGRGIVMGDQVFSAGPRPGAEPREPATEARVAGAETSLGFRMPADLRQLYLEVADGGVGPGDGVYSLSELVAKHAEMTAEPVGPQGQDWPAHLLPIQGPDWDLVSIDLRTGALVFWDLEELDDDESLPADQPTWSASFVPEADSLSAWLAAWAG